MKTIEEIFDFYFSNAERYLDINLKDEFNELTKDETLIKSIENAVKGVPSFQQNFKDVYEFRFFRSFLYSVIRSIKPKIVVETGVMHGLSSKFILYALEKNKKGELYSIDYPSYFDTGPSNKDGYNYTLPKDKEPGWIIEETSRARWNLRLGKSTELLPKVLENAGNIDIFIHDSEHTYETMTFELTTAWDRIRKGGICVCDNIESNSSFFDFCLMVNRVPLVLPAPGNDLSLSIRFALIVK